MWRRITVLVCKLWMLALTLHAQSALLNRPVSVNTTAGSIEDILKELSAVYGIHFSYSSDLLPPGKTISIQAEQQVLGEVLAKLLANTTITYTVIGNQVILQPSKKVVPATEQIVVSGYVKDASSGEALAGATLTYGNAGAVANTYGFYSLQVPAGPLQLWARYLGYANLRLEAVALKDTMLLISLQPLATTLQEVSISAELPAGLAQGNIATLQGTELKQLPRFMGEADAIKALQLMPGVQAGREGSSDIIVRGGSPDQNLILLDGVPVYNVSHLLGTFSVFNPDAIKKVDLIKGGFPAVYGGRLSSVIDIQLKEGNNQKFGGEGALGLLSSKLLLEGPIAGEKTSFLLAGRRTYLDMFTRAAALISGEPISNYHFYDLNAKLNHTFSATDRVFLSMYGGQDKFSDRYNYGGRVEQFSMQWGNATTALRWNHVYGPRLFSNVTLTNSRYNFGQNSSATQRQGRGSRHVKYGSQIKDWGAKADFDFAAHTRHYIRFGGSYTYHDFSPESATLRADTITLVINALARVFAHEYYTYAEDNIRLSERAELKAGMHFSGFLVNGTHYTSLQPRLSAGYTLPYGINLRASYATMAQYLHLVSNTATGTPTDIWVPATDKVKPQRSWQSTLGAATTLAQNQLVLSADIYYKEMKDVAEFRDGSDFVSDFLQSGPQTNFIGMVAPPYESRLAKGRGWSYGTEWMLRKQQGKTTGWVGYTLAWAWRQLEGINYNTPYPYTYDSRHAISTALNHRFTKKLSMGASWMYRTGHVTTLPTANYKAYNELVFLDPGQGDFNHHAIRAVDYYGERNNFRMPDYHRLDVSLTHTKQKKWGQRSWNLSVYNAYNRMNPYFLQVDRPFRRPDERDRTLYQVSLFPILPSISYGFTF